MCFAACSKVSFRSLEIREPGFFRGWWWQTWRPFGFWMFKKPVDATQNGTCCLFNNQAEFWGQSRWILRSWNFSFVWAVTLWTMLFQMRGDMLETLIFIGDENTPRETMKVFLTGPGFFVFFPHAFFRRPSNNGCHISAAVPVCFLVGGFLGVKIQTRLEDSG